MTATSPLKIYVAGHRGMVGSIILCELQKKVRRMLLYVPMLNALLKQHGYNVNLGIE